jgi:hypothetical protein
MAMNDITPSIHVICAREKMHPEQRDGKTTDAQSWRLQTIQEWCDEKEPIEHGAYGIVLNGGEAVERCRKDSFQKLDAPRVPETRFKYLLILLVAKAWIDDKWRRKEIIDQTSEVELIAYNNVFESAAEEQSVMTALPEAAEADLPYKQLLHGPRAHGIH